MAVNRGFNMSDRTVYWHLPGFFYNFYLNHAIIKLMQRSPEKFRDGYKIGSVYGTFPGAIWNGGRAVFGIVAKEDIQTVLKAYNDLDVPVRFTWTNSCIEQNHVYDTYCNLIMRLAQNGKNQVLVNTDVLEEYLRKNYPDFKFISSTTKRITDEGSLLEEMKKDYYMVVLDYDLNHDEKVLKELEPDALRVEILVDEICYAECPKRKDHYKCESNSQLEFSKTGGFDCPNRTTRPKFSESRKRPQFIGNEDIGSYIDRGFVNFKLVGRGLPQDFLLDSYMYYLVKDEYRTEVRSILERALSTAPGRR